MGHKEKHLWPIVHRREKVVAMSRKKTGAARDGRTIGEIDELLSQEVLRDLEAESQGAIPSVGEMQRAYPEAYMTARQLLSAIGQFAVVASISFKQAERISAMIHSEEEGLSSIQEILNMQPVTALTLVHLARLERKHRAKDAASVRHSQPGGSREKKEQLRTIWDSGKYDTRERCAEEEHEALGVSFHTALKYLRGTPKPSIAVASRD
jgi:hypothetical protein